MSSSSDKGQKEYFGENYRYVVMGKAGILLETRIKLDEAITYGTKRQAFRVARQGLKEAEAAGLIGEIEYFQGQLELLQGNFVSAIEHFDQAIRHNSKDAAAYNDRALCMVEIGILDAALPYFDKGIEAEPDYATIYHNKGWLLNNLGRHTEAIECFKKALTLEPNRAVTYENLADALYNLADFQEALKAYKMVLALLRPGQCRQIQRYIRKQIRAIERKVVSTGA